MEYPYSSPRMYDQNGRMKWGRVTWDPDPREGPYRPFYTREGYEDKSFARHERVEFVEARNVEELKIEIEQTRKTLTWHVFFCCFCYALKGLTRTRQASEHVDGGRDVEARDALLDAKINKSVSCCCGIYFAAFTAGGFQILTWIFVWIPLLILKCGKK